MKAKYTPLDYDSGMVVGAGTAYIQAAQVLDVLIQTAVRKDDGNTLLAAAALWLHLGELLDVPGEAPLEDKGPVGFNIIDLEEKVLDEEDLDE